MTTAQIYKIEYMKGFRGKKRRQLLHWIQKILQQRVHHTALLCHMTEMGTDTWIMQWIVSMLLKRTVALQYQSWSLEPRIIAPGPPKGYTLPPVLFNIYTARFHSCARLALTEYSQMLMTFRKILTI